MDDNAAVSELFRADQADRNVDPANVGALDWAAVSARDRARRTELDVLFRSGAIRTAGDYLKAAHLFQHGESTEDIRLAYSMASIAHALDPTNKEASWLTAASWDRLMRSMGRAQWYGTQYEMTGTEGKWGIDPIDPDVTDKERLSFGVPPLSELRHRLDELNASTGKSPRPAK